MTLVETLDRADQTREEAWDAIQGQVTITDSHFHLLLGYASLALEYQCAIVLLLRNNLTGSAFALVRPVFEILYKAHWVSACATPEEITKIRKGVFSFPGVAKMTSDIDAAIGSKTFGKIKEATWADQNEFTHSGMFQISSRLSRNSLPPDTLNLTIAQVKRTMIAALIIGALMLKHHHRLDDAARLEALAQVFEASYFAVQNSALWQARVKPRFFGLGRSRWFAPPALQPGPDGGTASSQLGGQPLSDIDEVIGDHTQTYPPPHPFHSVVAASRQSMTPLHYADPTFASRAPHCPCLNHRRFCSLRRSSLRVLRLGIVTYLTPISFTASSWLTSSSPHPPLPAWVRGRVCVCAFPRPGSADAGRLADDRTPRSV